MKDVIAIVNSGSSSLRFGLYPADGQFAEPVATGKITGIGRQPVLESDFDNDADEVTATLQNIPGDATHERLIRQVLKTYALRTTKSKIVGAGHRVVHGGQEFPGPVLIDTEVRWKLEKLVPLAPLHQPHNLSAIDAISEVLPDIPQIACFDTSFHQTQTKLAKMFALPRRLVDEGIIRYGFHGLSYEYISHILPELTGDVANGRVVVAHLGNGASMCAMNERRSAATSMGFTALDGLMMGRRCGSLDAGVVLHFLQNLGMSLNEVEHLLYRESGLLGVSGISNNMKVLQESTDPRAKEAIDLFCYRAACQLASLVTTLNGLDIIVFTAGIGENSAEVRELICSQLSWLGVKLDPVANAKNEVFINSTTSKVAVLVIPTNEEAIIAEHTRSQLRRN